MDGLSIVAIMKGDFSDDYYMNEEDHDLLRAILEEVMQDVVEFVKAYQPFFIRETEFSQPLNMAQDWIKEAQFKAKFSVYIEAALPEIYEEDYKPFGMRLACRIVRAVCEEPSLSDDVEVRDMILEKMLQFTLKIGKIIGQRVKKERIDAARKRLKKGLELRRDAANAIMKKLDQENGGEAGENTGETTSENASGNAGQHLGEPPRDAV